MWTGTELGTVVPIPTVEVGDTSNLPENPDVLKVIKQTVNENWMDILYDTVMLEVIAIWDDQGSQEEHGKLFKDKRHLSWQAHLAKEDFCQPDTDKLYGQFDWDDSTHNLL